MPEKSNPEQPKTLEMRVAELEDKLAKIHITEEELKAYQKVASLLGAAPAAAPGTSPCVAAQFSCIVRSCIIASCVIHSCIIRPQCIFECTCGPCNPQVGVGSISGSFGTLGS